MKKRIQNFIITEEFKSVYKTKQNRMIAIFQTIPRLLILILVVILVVDHAIPAFTILVAIAMCLDLLLSPRRFLNIWVCILDYGIMIAIILYWRLS